MWDYILDLSAERIWFGSVYATKMMLTKFDKYSNTKTGDGQCIFLRKLSCWHEKTLIPMEKKISQKHDVPDIFKPAFLEQAENFFSKGDVCGLHLYLLLLTSEHLVVQSKAGLGPETTEKVKEWFNLMRFVLESSLFEKCSIELKNEHRKIFQIFNEGESFILNEEEHSFFDPNLVFIHLSQLVVFYTRDPFKYDMDTWQTLSGELFQKVFQLESHGLQVLDDCSYKDETFCYSVQFPYIYLVAETKEDESNEDESLKDNNNLPSMFDLLFHFFNKFDSSIQKISQDVSKVQWKKELHKLHDIFHLGNKLNNAARDFSYRREKARRNYVKHWASGDGYNPRLPLNFQSDEYCFGVYSYAIYAHMNQTACKKRKHERKVSKINANTSEGLNWRSPGYKSEGNFLDSNETAI